MRHCLVVLLLFVVSSTMVLGQYDDKKHSGYRGDHKKHDGYGYGSPYDHSQIKKTGVYPGSLPEKYSHQKRPGYGGYGHQSSYGGHGGHGGYGGYGGYGYRHYEKCYLDFESYGPHQHRLRYLARTDEDDLNSNTSNFHPHKDSSHTPKCQNGPKKVVHKVYGEWHWPPVVKGVCDKLPGCKDPKCISVKTVKKSVCVIVFRRYGYRWVRVGFRKITFKTDLKCKCRECKDIKSFKECVNTHPCPNKQNPYSYCFWRKLSYDHKPKKYDDKPKYRPTKKPPTHTNKTRYSRDMEEEFYNNPEDLFEIDSDTEETNHEDVGARSMRSIMDYDRYDSYDKKGYKHKSYDKDPYDSYKRPLHPVPAGYCDCCVPVICKPPKQFDYDDCKCVCPKKKCLPGHYFNPKTCECECPVGTYLDKKTMRCIGICKKLKPKACEHVLCKDNPHFYCKLDKHYKCRCPDCDDVDYWQRGLCKKTNCIDQQYKPKCVFDWRNGKCRCPECEDQKNPKDCEKTICLVKYKKKQCKWLWYPYPTCACPDKYQQYGYGHDKKYDDDKKDRYDDDDHRKKDRYDDDDYRKKDHYDDDDYRKKDRYDDDDHKKKDRYDDDDHRKKDRYDDDDHKKNDRYDDDDYRKKDRYEKGYQKKEYAP